MRRVFLEVLAILFFYIVFSFLNGFLAWANNLTFENTLGHTAFLIIVIQTGIRSVDEYYKSKKSNGSS